MLMDPEDGWHQVYTMDVWDHRHRMLKSWNQLIFSSWAFWHHLPFLLFSLTAHNLCCLYARNRRGAVGAKARMNKLDRRVPQCLDKDALSLLHTSPWSLEPGRAIVNIHMQSISAQGETPLTIFSELCSQLCLGVFLLTVVFGSLFACSCFWELFRDRKKT